MTQAEEAQQLYYSLPLSNTCSDFCLCGASSVSSLPLQTFSNATPFPAPGAVGAAEDGGAHGRLLKDPSAVMVCPIEIDHTCPTVSAPLITDACVAH